MKRRDFLKILTVAPLAPSVLAAIPALPRPPEKLVGNEIYLHWVYCDVPTTCTIICYAEDIDGNLVEIDRWESDYENQA